MDGLCLGELGLSVCVGAQGEVVDVHGIMEKNTSHQAQCESKMTGSFKSGKQLGYFHILLLCKISHCLENKTFKSFEL